VSESDEQQREAWRRAATGWERRQADLREASLPVSRWLVDAVAPQAGQTILELAAGPGETGFMAAQRLGENGTLISSDQSPEMVDVARRRAAELGLQNVRFEVLDAQRLDPGLGPVDAVLCRWGLMLMGDPDAALGGIKAVLREGGRLALATWDTPDKNLWMAVPGMQLVARGALPMPSPNEPGPFSMADPDALARRLGDAGLRNPRTDKVTFAQSYPSFDDYWAITIDLAAPLAVALESLDDEARAEVREAVRAAVQQFASPDGTIEVPASAVVATATA
jgi:SAM-dependent methyltransferase